jgi:uncharacterized protein (TIGR04141 family)
LRLRSTIPTRNPQRLDTFILDHLAYGHSQAINGKNYLYESGAWYEATARWATKLENDMDPIHAGQAAVNADLQPLPFDLAQHANEDGYIDAACVAGNGRATKCHRSFPPTALQLELCDILVDGKYLLFLKRGCDSAACADAGRQARQAAHARLDEPSYATWARTTFFDPQGWPSDFAQRTNFTFVLVLITNDHAKVPCHLTVRAQDSLAYFRSEIGRLAFSTAVIPV